MLVFLLTVSSLTLAGIGGLYYAFACSIMPGLKRVDDAAFVSTMSRINVAIQNLWFALSFVGAFLALGGTAIYAWLNGLSTAIPATAAWVLYSITLVITARINIPLNNRLDEDAKTMDAATARSSFEGPWTRWNVHRSWISFAALLCLCAAWATSGMVRT